MYVEDCDQQDRGRSKQNPILAGALLRFRGQLLQDRPSSQMFWFAGLLIVRRK
jgi:hypothetical protein